MDFNYEQDFKSMDFRAHPDRYQVGKGEQGVLLVEPYKSEILPHWRFKDPETALESAQTIFNMFLRYKEQNDFVGMDMARKYLQMGFTRARRYANHPSGRKYKKGTREELPRQEDPVKAAAAKIFYQFYLQARDDPDYKELRQEHKNKFG